MNELRTYTQCQLVTHVSPRWIPQTIGATWRIVAMALTLVCSQAIARNSTNTCTIPMTLTFINTYSATLVCDSSMDAVKPSSREVQISTCSITNTGDVDLAAGSVSVVLEKSGRASVIRNNATGEALVVRAGNMCGGSDSSWYSCKVLPVGTKLAFTIKAVDSNKIKTYGKYSGTATLFIKTP